MLIWSRLTGLHVESSTGHWTGTISQQMSRLTTLDTKQQLKHKTRTTGEFRYGHRSYCPMDIKLCQDGLCLDFQFECLGQMW